MAVDTRAAQTGRRLLLVDPTTEPTAARFMAAPRLGDLSNKRVGLIDDSKLNARELLEEVASVLTERFGVSDVRYHRKPSASRPATPETIAEMAAGCDFVIAGVGD